MKPALFAAPASEEWAEATRWYEERRPGLGAEFHDAIVTAVTLIEAHPEIGTLRPGLVPARELNVTRFPYKIVYYVRTSELYVVAVAHTRRRPGYWRDR